MRIGVFDSGVGGESVTNAIRQALPEHEIIYVNDRKNIPYGTKSPDQLLKLVTPIFDDLATRTDVIVVACNTVTTTIIEELRKRFTLPLIGIEPMVKPAAEQTKSHIIAVCATPTTLASPRYGWLKDTYAKDIKVLEPDCGNWTELIENKEIDQSHVHKQIDSVCKAGADVIVLGCTHYHWIEEIIKKETKSRAVIIQPEQPVIAQLKRVLEQLA